MYYECGGEWGPVTFPAFKAFFCLCLERPSHANTRKHEPSFRSPCAFLPAPPPNDSHGCGVLLLTQNTLGICEEGRFIGVINAPFIAHQETIGHRIIERDGVFFECLVQAAEQPSTVGEILRAGGQSDLWRELVFHVSSAAIDVRRSRRLARSLVSPQALNEVIPFERKGQFRRDRPRHVTVENVGSTVWSWTYRLEAKARLNRDRSRRRNYYAIRMLLPKIVIHRPGHRFRRLCGEPK